MHKLLRQRVNLYHLQIIYGKQMSKIFKALLLFAIILCGATFAAAQQQSMPRPIVPASRADRNDNDDDMRPLGSPEREMLDKQRLASFDSRHREFQNRAQESARLALSLHQGFAQSDTLNQAGWKNLERIAKLVRQVREFSGGSNDDDEHQSATQNPSTPSMPPIKDTLRTLVELTAQLADAVEHTPKHVVSATIINRANDVIDLVEQLKRTNRTR